MNPSDRPQGEASAASGAELASRPIQIPRALAQGLKQLAQPEGVSLHGALAGLWGALLGRGCGQEALLVRTPAAEPATALVVDTSGDPSFRELLRRIALPPNGVGNRRALGETCVALRSAALRGSADAAGSFALALRLEETPRDVRGALEYRCERLDAVSAEQLVKQLRRWLEAVLRAPDARLSSLELPEPPAGAKLELMPAPPSRHSRRARGEEQLAVPSLVQRRLWFLHELLEDRSVYNVGVGFRLSGPLDVSRLERCFGELVARHEILRTRLELDGGDLVQVIEPAFPVSLRVVDLSRCADAEARVPEIGRRHARMPFDLGRCPLWRLELLRLAPEHHVLVFVVHHVASDVWSIGILFQELAQLYGAALRDARLELPALGMQYADFAEWQQDWLRSETCRRGVEFWRRELAGAPPILDLPTDRPRPAVASYRGGVVSRRIARPIFDSACALGRQERATPFMVLMACFQALLFRYTGEPDVAVGVTSTSRPDARLEQLFGCFLNALVLRARATAETPFRALLDEVKQRAWAAFDQKDVPFELVVDALAPRRDRSHAPLFQALLVYENLPVLALAPDGETPETAFGTDALRMRAFGLPTDTTKYDLTLYAWPGAEGLLLQCEYAADLFDAKTVERWLEHFEVLLRHVCVDPEARLGEIPLCDASLTRALGPRLAFPSAGGVHALFERAAAEAPEAVALRGMGLADVSRGELNARANRLACELRARGVGIEDRVGICLERSPALVVAVLAVWKAGAAYVPLDPSYPRERLAYLVEDSRMRLAISRAGLAERMPFGDLTVLPIEECSDFLAQHDASDLHVAVTPENLAYVLYTSGSTGRPKGVLGLHRTLLNRIGWEPFPPAPGEVCAFRTSLNFIDSVWEIVGALGHGMASAIVAEDVARDPWRLADCLELFGVTRLFLVPTLLKSMLEADLDWSRLQGVRYWLCGGEPLQAEVARRFAAAAPDAVLLNMYGTTEFWDAAWHDAQRTGNGAHIPIGMPIANVETWVLDSALHVVPPGVAGELYVSGSGLARGYHGQPGLTAERFLPHPHAERAGQRLYRTGDRARIQSDGAIEVLGRADSQTKIRGHRVELAEVEDALLRHPGVREAVVGVRELAGERQLVAWVVGASGEPLALDALRAHAQRFLPDYALPSAVLALERMPMTPSGKIDRKALPEPADAVATHDAAAGGPVSETERALAALWESVLEKPVPSVHANFFGLGGDSVQMVRIVAGARRQGLALSLREFYAEPSVAALARVVERARLGTVPATAGRKIDTVVRWWLDGPGRALRLRLDVRVFELAPEVSVAALEHALRALEPVFPARIARNGDGWRWEESDAEPLTLANVVLDRLGVADRPAAAWARIEHWSSRMPSPERDPVCAAVRIEARAHTLLALRIAPWRLGAGGWPQVAAALAERMPAGALRPASIPARLRRESPSAAGAQSLPRVLLETQAAALRLRLDELLMIAAARALASLPASGGWSVEAVLSRVAPEPWPQPLREPLPDDLLESVRRAKVQLRASGSVDPAAPVARRLFVRVEDLPQGSGTPPTVRLRGARPAGPARVTELSALRRDDRIEIFWSADPHAAPAAHRALAAAFDAQLRQLLELRVGAGETLAPSDFPDAQLDAGELEGVLGRCEERGQDLTALAEILPLSATQLGMVYHRLYEPESNAYFQQLSFDLDGVPDLRALRRACQHVVRECDVLRMTVEWDGLSEPHQLVWSAIEPRWHVLDLRRLDAAEQTRALEELIGAGRRDGFDVAQAAPHCWIIARRGERAYTFIFSYHHVVLDGWSMALVFSRFFELYQAYASGRTPALEPTPAFRDFIRWYRAQDLDEARRHWREKLAGFALATPVDLRTSRAAVEDWDEVELALGAEATARMEELARALRVTPSTQLYAAWALVLGRRAATRDVLFGATVSGRSPELPDVERRVGLFINTVPVRVALREDERIDRWLGALQQTLGEQTPFESTPLPIVQQCSEVAPGRPLFHSIVIFENFPMDERLQRANPDGQVSRAHLYERTSYPLTLAAVPTRGESLRLRLIFDRAVVEPADAQKMLDDVALALRSFPARREERLGALWPRRVATPRQAIAPPGVLQDGPQLSLLETIESHARRTPEHPAVEQGGRSISYRALAARANRIARALEQRGVGRGDVIGVRMPRSIDAIAALLGVLKAGAAYLPLEPADPCERAERMLRDAKARLLLTTAELGAVSETLATLRLDVPDLHLEGLSGADVAPRAGASDLAYVIYTSGSTGRPKGVAVERRSLEFYTRAAAREYALAASDRVLQFASLCFDASAEEIFPCLLAGATLVLRSDEMIDSPSVYLEALQSERISVASLPTAYWHELCHALEQGADAPRAPLRLLVIGGEAARARAWAHWLAKVPGSIRVVNTYGPTEATIVATWCDLHGEAAREPLPIGRPVPGVRSLVADAEGYEVPPGTPGELYLGGPGIARGYLNNPGLSAERFVPDPDAVDGTRLYRTGDIVRERADGCLEYLGRADDQVKIRGIRVEPREVENLLAQHAAVAACAVVAVGDAARRRLVAFVVAAEVRSEELGAALRAFASARLPRALVPDAIHVVERLPQTSRGKLDRIALIRQAEAQAPRSQADEGPRTAAEELMSALWCQVLELPHVGIDESFVDLGGNSLSGARLMFAVEHAFGVRVSLKRLFEAATVSGLCRLLQDPTHSASGTSVERDLPRLAELPDDVRPSWSGAPGAPRAALITGATGFVGAFLLAELLARTDLRIHALVRASDAASARERIAQTLARYRLPLEGLERVHPVLGDLRAARLGLDPSAAEALASDIQAIYHVGALVHNAAYESLESVNVRGTHEILRLACSGAPKTLHHVSSMAVVHAASDVPPSLEVDESSPLEEWRRLPNGYLQTKWVAERGVREAASRGLPIVVYRPGMVSAATVTGAVALDHIPARVIGTLLEMGALPLSGPNDIIRPIAVDQLARAIVHLSVQTASLGQTFHLFEPRPAQLADMSTWLRSYGYALEQLPRREWIERVALRGRRSALFRALSEAILDADAVQRELLRDLVWTNTATVRALEPAKIAWNSFNEQHLHATLRYWIDAGFLAGPSTTSEQAGRLAEGPRG